MDRKVIIIPTYNEKENIEKIIRKVFTLPEGFHILVIDDGSPDGTADIVKRLQKEFTENLHILERKGKLGLGRFRSLEPSMTQTASSGRWVRISPNAPYCVVLCRYRGYKPRVRSCNGRDFGCCKRQRRDTPYA